MGGGVLELVCTGYDLPPTATRRSSCAHHRCQPEVQPTTLRSTDASLGDHRGCHSSGSNCSKCVQSMAGSGAHVVW
jgi:hypothetical protein